MAWSVADGPTPVKILIAGGFGAGKTTFVDAVSETPGLTTEASGEAGTVGLDLGRITMEPSGVILYLFGTPGQGRFWFRWDELVQGAIGAVILVDPRRVEDSFAAIDFFEDRRVPFVLAVNEFDGAPACALADVASAANLDAGQPVVRCDARDGASARAALAEVVRHALRLAA